MSQLVAQILRDALKLMNDEGAHWTKGAYYDYEGPDGSERFCSVGAIVDVVERQHDGSSLLVDRAIERVAQVVAPTSEQDPGFVVTTWNDYKGRTWPEVVEAFTQATQAAEQAE